MPTLCLHVCSELAEETRGELAAYSKAKSDEILALNNQVWAVTKYCMGVLRVLQW